MVKKTKIKHRPRRLFMDDKTNRYFYLINNKKKYIITNKDTSSKAIARVNIQNILPVPVRRKTIRPREFVKPITNIQVVSKLVPIAPTQANLTDKLYKSKDNDLEKRLLKLEENSKPTLITTSTAPVPTSTAPTSYFSRITKAKAKAPTPTTLSRESSTMSLYGTQVKKPDILGQRFINLFKSSTAKVSPPQEDLRPKLKNMTKKQFESSLVQFDKKITGEITSEDYPKYLEWQRGSKIYSAYEPAPYDYWISDIRFLKEIETLPPEEKLSNDEKASIARRNYFEPLTLGSKIMVKAKEGAEESKGEAEVPTGSLLTSGMGQYENDDDGIYNNELQEIFKDKMNKFLPVIPSDRMNELLPLVNKDTKKFGWIQNTEPSTSMGRHWTAFFIDVPNMEVNYYDSLVENGGEPTKESMKGLRKIVDKIHPEYYLKFKYSTIREQNFNSKNCGYFSLKMIMDRYRNVPFKTASGYDKICNDEVNGEKMIKRFKKYL